MNKSLFYFTNREIDQKLINEFKKINTKRGSQKVLEVGCGDGVMVYDISKLGYLKNVSLSAVDISTQNIKYAKSRKLRCKFSVADAQNLPFNTNSFDFVYSWMVIEHVANPNKMISEIKRVLKPGGRCYISTIMKKKWAIYFYRKNGKFVLDPTHISEFSSKKEFLNLFKANGLLVNTSSQKPANYSIAELLAKIFIKIDLFSSFFDRNVFYKNSILKSIQKIKINIPGFYRLSCVAQLK